MIYTNYYLNSIDNIKYYNLLLLKETFKLLVEYQFVSKQYFSYDFVLIFK